MQFTRLGDSAVTIRFGTAIDREVWQQVQRARAAVLAAALPGVRDVVPAFTTLTVHYWPQQVTRTGTRTAAESLMHALRQIVEHPPAQHSVQSERIEIPVLYGGEFGPDLEELAASRGLGVDEVIRIHSSTEYLAYMLGFAPGFAYLGGLDPRLHTPRRADPRVRVPASSVAIGGQQTAVYPLDLPGGWHLIGRTPLRMFDPHRIPATLIGSGDLVRFVPIDRDEFERLRQ